MEETLVVLIVYSLIENLYISFLSGILFFFFSVSFIWSWFFTLFNCNIHVRVFLWVLRIVKKLATNILIYILFLKLRVCTSIVLQIVIDIFYFILIINKYLIQFILVHEIHARIGYETKLQRRYNGSYEKWKSIMDHDICVLVWSCTFFLKYGYILSYIIYVTLLIIKSNINILH